VLRFQVDSADLLHSRFALSPVFELEGLLRVLDGVDGSTPPSARIDRLRPGLARLRAEDAAVEALLALQHPHGGADFVVPPPARGALQTIDDDLLAVRAVPLEVARADIRTCLARRPAGDRAREVLDAPDVVPRIADALARAWHHLLATDWLQLRAICERDIVHRAGQLARHGWAAALDGLHPRVRWRRGGVEIARMSSDGPVALGGQGLTFVPSVFVWPNVAAFTADPWPRCLIYPARGIGQWWDATSPDPPAKALEELIGRTRARILQTLHEPASTTQVAHQLGLPVGSAGDHLRAMRRAGVLDATRSGRSVLYRRTPLGEMLADA
jgi:DNA-binding transcriptional ArsR family regulator